MKIPRIHIPRWPLAAFILFSTSVCLAPSFATAQDRNQLGVLAEQIQQLQSQFIELQKQFYRGDAPSPNAINGNPDSNAEAFEDLKRSQIIQAGHAAQFELRLTNLEEDIRNLTGLLEEIGFGVRQNRQSMDRFIQDMDFRMQAIEQSLTNAVGEINLTPEAAGPGLPVTAPEGAPPVIAGPVPVEPGGDPGLAGEQVLGVLTMTRPNENLPNAASPNTPAERIKTPEEEYEIAYALLQQFRVEEAEQAFRNFLEIFPEHSLARNAHYWLGETYYSRKMFNEAARTFWEAYRKAPEGEKAPDNYLKLGMSLANMGEAGEACTIFATLPQQFPDLTGEIPAQAAVELGRLNCQ